MIGRRGERGSGISMLAARHDDDDSMALVKCKRQALNKCKILPLLFQGTHLDLT